LVKRAKTMQGFLSHRRVQESQSAGELCDFCTCRWRVHTESRLEFLQKASADFLKPALRQLAQGACSCRRACASGCWERQSSSVAGTTQQGVKRERLKSLRHVRRRGPGALARARQRNNRLPEGRLQHQHAAVAARSVPAARSHSTWQTVSKRGGRTRAQRSATPAGFLAAALRRRAVLLVRCGGRFACACVSGGATRGRDARQAQSPPAPARSTAA
jgi:hypothetical protein